MTTPSEKQPGEAAKPGRAASAAGAHPASVDENALLSVDRLVKHFPIKRGIIFQRQIGAVRAVDGVSFAVRAGETLGLVGESGCGKSTTGRVVTKLLEPTSGSIRFDGRDISSFNAGRMRPLRTDIQMIFQDPYSSLNPRHTIGTIVGAPFRIHKTATEHGISRMCCVSPCERYAVERMSPCEVRVGRPVDGPTR